MRRVLVTGAFGQVGRALLERLSSSYEVLASDRSLSAHRSPEQAAIPLDITDPAAVGEVLEAFQPEVTVNLAALTDVDGCERNPRAATLTNVGGVQNLVEAFQGKLIHLSSDYVFNGSSGPYSEEDPTDPINHYGRTKLESEAVVQAGMEHYIILRSNVIFSYSRSTQASFLNWVVDSLQQGRQIRVVDDQWNNPTWTVALAEVIENLIDREEVGLYHYGGAEVLNRYDFARRIATTFDLDERLILPVATADLNQAAPRPLRAGLKTERIQGELGVRPYLLEDCLRSIRKEARR